MYKMTSLTRRAVLASLVLAAGAMTGPLAQAQGAKVLKLGSIATLTGPNASIGREILVGMEYAVKTTNAAGGVRIGADTYTLELVNIDDESKQERAVAAAQRLIGSEKISVIFTPPASTATLAVLPILEKNKVLGMSFVAAAPAVITPEFSYSFRSSPNSLTTVQPMLDFLVKEKGFKTIAYLGRNDDWGRSVGKALIGQAKKSGASIVVEEYFDTTSTDFTGLLTKARNANPDAVINASFIEDGVSFLKQFRELRMKAALVAPAVIWASPTFLKAAGKAAEGVFVTTGPTTSDTPSMRAYAQQYEKTTGRQTLPYEVVAYDSVMLVLDAMKKAGSTDVTKVRDTLHNLEYKGVLQDYKFNGTNQSEVLVNITEIKDGRAVVLTSFLSDTK